MGKLTGKVIVITGASSGIGKALALQMADSKVKLILAARRIDELENICKACEKKGSECIILYVDLEKPDSISGLASQIKSHSNSVDILVNNAGISQRSKAEETPIEVDRKIMEVNFFGQVMLTKLLWPLLLNSTHANIVLLSSVVGTFGFSQRSAYSASKHAIEGFFESWMIENSHPNIFFTTVSPGRILTNISYSALKADGSAHQKLDAGQEHGITSEKCAERIIKGIQSDKRKIYIVKQELVMVLLRKCFPYLFFRIAKKLKSI